ncbi:TetR/AcrR family transcriptional regulator [Oceanobacillus jeddahense]|uniref:TetR/AcrR family transcriptional regulator n=1 Tax=Oceanobacillus jeddahense TaxID=1462527 RepID=A0ABY5JQ73_9BACI|nr:TetR/AcrR family transcriptional regulator [Oceanobacillus jeddahense]UUI02251.1 TetR/AcrR family transcriptional regulator [Oceanobacillus jeddahense]
MRKNTKEEIIQTTALLIQEKGYVGTGLKEIIEQSGAPRGSIYYHFPDGKEQIALEAVKWTKEAVISFIQEELTKHDDALTAIQAFVLDSADRFEENRYFVGVPISALILETSSTSEKLRKSCEEAFEAWSQEFMKKLQANGYETETAQKLGTLINTMIQGALVTALASKHAASLRTIAEVLPLIFIQPEQQ